MIMEIKVSIVKGPIREGGMSEQGGALSQSCQGSGDGGIRSRGVLDVMGWDEIEGIDNYRVWNNGGMCVILSGVDVVLVKESIGRSHLCPRSNLLDNVKVLKEEEPASLVTREFVRVLQIQ